MFACALPLLWPIEKKRKDQKKRTRVSTFRPCVFFSIAYQLLSLPCLFWPVSDMLQPPLSSNSFVNGCFFVHRTLSTARPLGSLLAIVPMSPLSIVWTLERRSISPERMSLRKRVLWPLPTLLLLIDDKWADKEEKLGFFSEFAALFLTWALRLFLKEIEFGILGQVGAISWHTLSKFVLGSTSASLSFHGEIQRVKFLGWYDNFCLGIEKKILVVTQLIRTLLGHCFVTVTRTNGTSVALSRLTKPEFIYMEESKMIHNAASMAKKEWHLIFRNL